MSVSAYYTDSSLPLSLHDPGQIQSTNDPENPVSPNAQPASASASPAQQSRNCSIRGCSRIVSADSGTKMCETCRGRHRVYANTKRAKRKMEKAAINGLGQPAGSENQPPIWIPEYTSGSDVGIGSATAPAASPNLSTARPRTEEPSLALEPHTSASPPLNHPVIDPRLITYQSSELVGALTLPNLIPPTPRSMDEYYSDRNTASAEPATHAEGLSSPRGNHSSEADKAAAPSSSSGSAPSSSSYPPRFCSVKGCKAIISGDYFFKMCQSCRDRYRGYGITKRAKWKQERVEENAEMDNHRGAEDKRRAEAGLPSLAEASTDDWNAWASKFIKEPDPDRTTMHGHPLIATRMCTVSHCHKLLPGHYKYRRCEQHRIQNRHHSKLKRVREKESKALGPPDESRNGEGRKKKAKATEPLFTREPMDMDRDKTTDLDEDGKKEEDSIILAGVPPPARGIRRANHVCCVKTCFNLLSPQVPWKMCDVCRSHDRLARQHKRSRQKEHPNPENEAPNSTTAQSSVQGGEAIAVILDTDENDPVPSSSDVVRSLTPTAEDPSTLPQATSTFDDFPTSPSAPPESTSSQHPEASTSNSTTIDHPSIQANPIISGQIDRPAETVPSITITAVDHSETGPPPVSAPSTSEAQSRKKGGRPKAKVKEKASMSNNGKVTSAPATATIPAPVIAPNSTPKASGSTVQHPVVPPYPPYATHIQPQYQVPYYMPPPYSMPPYNMPHSGTASAVPNHPPYPPSAYPPYHPYGPYAMQPYSYPPYLTQPYSFASSQIPLQPYGATANVGQSKFGSVPPGASPYERIEFRSLDSQLASGERRRKRRRVDHSEAAVQKYHELNHHNDLATPPTASHLLPVMQPLIRPPEEHVVIPESSKSPSLNGEVEISDPGRSEIETDDQASMQPSDRQCSSKTCHRTIPPGSCSTLCESCRTRIKKHQAKRKQRYRLEPRKQVIGVIGKADTGPVPPSK